MHVRHALADPVVDGDEEAIRLHPGLDGAREALHVPEEGASELGREIEHRLAMEPGNEEAMAREQRAMVEEREEISVLEDQVSGELARGYPAEGALSGGHWRVLP